MNEKNLCGRVAQCPTGGCIRWAMTLAPRFLQDRVSSVTECARKWRHFDVVSTSGHLVSRVLRQSGATLRSNHALALQRHKDRGLALAGLLRIPIGLATALGHVHQARSDPFGSSDFRRSKTLTIPEDQWAQYWRPYQTPVVQYACKRNWP
jgi:hypothetical protein